MKDDNINDNVNIKYVNPEYLVTGDDCDDCDNYDNYDKIK